MFLSWITNPQREAALDPAARVGVLYARPALRDELHAGSENLAPGGGANSGFDTLRDTAHYPGDPGPVVDITMSAQNSGARQGTGSGSKAGQGAASEAPQTPTPAGPKPMSPSGNKPKSPTFQPDEETPLTGNLVNGGKQASHQDAVLWVLRTWLRAKGVETLPSRPRELYPAPWKVGNTEIPVERGMTSRDQLQLALPSLRVYRADGSEIHWEPDSSPDVTSWDRVKAEWDPPVEIVAYMLSTIQARRIVKDDVLRLAQASPQALEKLKQAGSDFKAHFQRYLDPVALRRSPEFNRVSARYKAELRVLIEDQQEKIRQARAATRRVNQLLGERDQELARLDSGYTPKRATAAAALAAFGISLDDEGDSISGEGVVTGVDLEDLNF